MKKKTKKIVAVRCTSEHVELFEFETEKERANYIEHLKAKGIEYATSEV